MMWPLSWWDDYGADADQHHRQLRPEPRWRQAQMPADGSVSDRGGSDVDQLRCAARGPLPWRVGGGIGLDRGMDLAVEARDERSVNTAGFGHPPQHRQRVVTGMGTHATPVLVETGVDVPDGGQTARCRGSSWELCGYRPSTSASS